jgi:transcriptional regulator with XRE-family HTH domain
MTLGERILILRRRLKMSQSMVARAARVDTNTIARLEQGRVHDLSGDTIVRVARALHVSTDVLLGVAPLDDEDEPALRPRPRTAAPVD